MANLKSIPLRCVLFCLIIIGTKQTISAQAIQGDPSTLPNDSIRNSEENWGDFTPGRGFQVANTKYGTLNISGYMLARYMDQMPPSQVYYDHLGNQHVTDGRNDILWHRVQAFLTGWVYDPKLTYNITFWTVNATNQVAIAGNMSFHFNKYFNLTAGINSLGGTRSLQGSHPYWLGTDRVMADEYFRTGFTSAVWATGEPIQTFIIML